MVKKQITAKIFKIIYTQMNIKKNYDTFYLCFYNYRYNKNVSFKV
jgi:hypothetical protein